MDNDVSTPSESVMAMSDDLAMLGALLGGTHAMRAAEQKFLPKWPTEDQVAYTYRIHSATLFPAYARTIKTLAGKPFSKPITIGDDVPAQIKTWAEDIDLQGRNLHAFTSEVFEHALGYGLSGILVDYPEASDVKTLADERAQGLRPYCIHIKAKQIRGWRSARIQGIDTLTQLRIMESVAVNDGAFATATIDQVRVLFPGAYQLWRQNKKKEWVLFQESTTSLKVIPFVPVYGDMMGFMVGRAPLMDMAYLNVEHWQSASDQQTILHVARVPILVITGVDDTYKLTIGAGAAISLPMGATIGYAEHSGAAITAGRESLSDLEDRMRQAGAELLQLNMRRVTATQIHMENELGMSALQRIAQSSEDAFDSALQLMADWTKLGPAGHVTLFSDYGGVTLSDSMAELLNMELSNETRFQEAQRRGIVSPDLTWQEETQRLELQGPPLAEFQGKVGGVPSLAPVGSDNPVN